MKEIKTNKVQRTKKVVLECGLPSVTINRVVSQNEQKALCFEFDLPLSDPQEEEEAKNCIRFIPKKIFNIVVDEASVNEIVQKIIEVNYTEGWKARALKPNFRRMIP